MYVYTVEECVVKVSCVLFLLVPARERAAYLRSVVPCPIC